jgi:putative addiction module component (TIGR02574 family)
MMLLPMGGRMVVMARGVAEIEQEIRALSSGEQKPLLRALLEELDGSPDADVEQAWLDEVQRRRRELEEGTVKPIPADEVFAKLRADLKSPRIAALKCSYFGLKEYLEALFGRPADLVMTAAVRNPYVRAEIDRDRTLLYAA